MAIKNRDELLNTFRERYGANNSDEDISFLEDLTDTLQDYETRTQDSTNWQQRYNDNDAMWRQKYHDRFFAPTGTQDDEPDPIDEKPKVLTFEALFKEG